MPVTHPETRYRTIGLISGVKAEQDAVLPRVARQSTNVAGLTVNHLDLPVGKGEEPRLVVACTPGIGKVNAAAAAAVLSVSHQLDLLVVVGTAGKINPQLPPTAFLLPEALHADYGAYRDGGFVHYRAGTLPIGAPKTVPFASKPAMRLLQANPSLASARIASGDSFVEDAERSQSLHEATGADLVDMETAAVAQVAERMSIDWLAVKAVSDDANEDSAASFAQQLTQASGRAARLLEQLLGLSD